MGPLRRELYPKHLEFFAAGLHNRERCFMAANRVGKTVAGGCEVTYHATGEYPDWWTGYRVEGPSLIWAAGDTGKTTRDIIQLELLGPPGNFGTGLIPGDRIIRTPSKQGISDAVEFIYVKHKSGGESVVNLKSYDQRREAFQGGKPRVLWLDEECPEDIYGECLTRTMTNDGRVMLTFTPLQGLTQVVKAFVDDSPLFGNGPKSGNSAATPLAVNEGF
jgi:phage terminase large subunit-like protein